MSRRRHDAERLRAALIDVELVRTWRIIPSRFADRPLGCVPAPSRFSDPALGYAVLYVGSSVRCALREALLRDRFLEPHRGELPVELIESRYGCWTCTATAPRASGCRRRLPAIGVTRPAGRCRVRSTRWCRRPTASSTTADSSAMPAWAVFDRGLEKLEASTVTPLVSSAEVRDALTEEDIALIDRRPR